MNYDSELCPEMIDVNDPKFIAQIAAFQELQNRIVVFRCTIENLRQVIDWGTGKGIMLKVRNHWSAQDNGGFASFEMLKETFTEENKVMFLLRWA